MAQRCVRWTAKNSRHPAAKWPAGNAGTVGRGGRIGINVNEREFPMRVGATGPPRCPYSLGHELQLAEVQATLFAGLEPIGTNYWGPNSMADASSRPITNGSTGGGRRLSSLSRQLDRTPTCAVVTGVESDGRLLLLAGGARPDGLHFGKLRWLYPRAIPRRSVPDFGRCPAPEDLPPAPSTLAWVDRANSGRRTAPYASENQRG